jgi:hypothetical protein
VTRVFPRLTASEWSRNPFEVPGISVVPWGRKPGTDGTTFPIYRAAEMQENLPSVPSLRAAIRVHSRHALVVRANRVSLAGTMARKDR